MAEEDEEPRPQSIQERIAALKLNQVARSPTDDKSSTGPLKPSRALPPQPPRPSKDRPPPQPPRPSAARPGVDTRRKTANNPPLRTDGTATARQVGNEPLGARNNGVLPPPSIQRTSSSEDTSRRNSAVPPQLPARKDSEGLSPALPPRRPSENNLLNARRASIESTSSARSSVSAHSVGAGTTSTARPHPSETPIGRIKAPVYDAASLPRLPPKRSEVESKANAERIPSKSSLSSSLLQHRRQSQTPIADPPTPQLPPRLPDRRPSAPDPEPAPEKRRVLAPEIVPALLRRSALSFGMNKTTEKPPPLPSARPDTTSASTPPPLPSSRPEVTSVTAPPPLPSTRPDLTSTSSAPPIPVASRPDLSQYQATKPGSTSTTSSSCLKCRDFSAPDAHAAKFPRQSIPSTSTAWLSNALTSPFASPTDKARAIFTWLHHNIAYDTAAFFGGNVKPSTPASTMTSGLAVCEGYAGLFCALAAPAGLEAVVIGGHGKGFGFSALAPGSPIPPYTAGHAWNAVKLPDSGSPSLGWKLVDPCWGAGHVDGASQSYVKAFNPAHFTMTNVEFGRSHFPDDRRSFYREDGQILSWEVYFIGDVPGGGEAVQIPTSVPADYGLSERSFQPRARAIPVASGETVHFEFRKTCPHWNHLTMGSSPGAPYCFTIAVRGGKDHLPLEYDEREGRWWIDVPVGQLGGRGQTVGINAVTVVDGKDARGLSKEGFQRAWGKKSMRWEGVGIWVLE